MCTSTWHIYFHCIFKDYFMQILPMETLHVVPSESSNLTHFFHFGRYLAYGMCNVVFQGSNRGWLVPIDERFHVSPQNSLVGTDRTNEATNWQRQNVRLITHQNYLSIGSWYHLQCGMWHRPVETTWQPRVILPFWAKKSFQKLFHYP